MTTVWKIKCLYPEMTGQNDRQDRSLTGQVRDQAGHCPLTGRYLQPCSGPFVGAEMPPTTLFLCPCPFTYTSVCFVFRFEYFIRRALH